jgi:ADP-dependent NAD(P)H-hydrate dehydratase / NAD(P)H-hydrate epimerase
MKTVSAKEMRELDRRTIKDGTPGEILMERAGQSVADAAADQLAACNGFSVLLIAGTGNNGGDVFAAATELARSDLDIEVWICGARGKVVGDAKTHLDRMIRTGILPKELRSENDFVPKFNPDLIVDGLLGTGAKGAPRGLMAPLIDWINREADFAQILSIDIPSGVDADTGIAEGLAVRADLTVTMGLPKTGLIRPEALPYIGDLEVADIGIPPEFIEDTAGCSNAEYIDRTDVFVPRRARDSHKGTFGRILLIGGSTGMTGAIAMAARAALRSGAGLVNILTPAEVYPIVAQAAGPEVMAHPLESALPGLNRYDAVLAGPGMGRTEQTRQRIKSLLNTCTVPLVLDADALAVVSPEQIGAAHCPVVLTPHPGEFERLFGNAVTDRWAQAREAAEQTGKTVVLKGAGTVIAEKEQRSAVNLTGNPGMATGGSGDVLAGMLTAFLGQGLPPFEAAKTAVYLHGLAGDLAAERLTQTAMLPTDLIEALPDAFRLCRFR